MLKSYLIAAISIAGLMVAWALVQRAWGRMFLPDAPHDDALERRISCGKCGCATPCDTSTRTASDERGRVSLDH